jgi:ribosomal protein S6
MMRFEKWEERDLAYRIADYTRGIYYIMIYRSQPSGVSEIEKNLRFLNTDVLRFMTLNITEEKAFAEKGASETRSNNGGI